MSQHKVHPKIAALKLKAKPINLSDVFINEDGELSVVDEQEMIIEGYLSVFNVRDYAGETVVKGAFAKSINERGPNSSSKYKILMLWQHDMCEPIGQFLELKEDDYGLYFKAKLDNIEEGTRAFKQIMSGTVNQFSIGYNYVWDKVKYDEATDTIYLLEIELFEGSVVTIGANMETYAIKSLENFADAKDLLDSETETYIKSLPRPKQLELRTLISKHIALAEVEPSTSKMDTLKKKQAEDVKGILKVGDYKLNINEFKK